MRFWIRGRGFKNGFIHDTNSIEVAILFQRLGFHVTDQWRSQNREMRIVAGESV